MVKLLSDTLHKSVGLLKQYNFKNKQKVLHSLPVDSLLKRMMLVSDNFLAEHVLLMCSSNQFDTLKSEKTIEYMQKNYFYNLPDRAQWIDGSGLSRYNLITPRAMAAVLNKLWHDIPHRRLLNLFPVGGVSGTIKHWYKADTAYVYAKTGTFLNNHTLCGFIHTKKNNWLIFCFMHNNFTSPANDIRKEMEQILVEIKNSY